MSGGLQKRQLGGRQVPVELGEGVVEGARLEQLDQPGVLDATRCLAYWTQTAGAIPDDVMDALEDRVYGCDICQDVCPWNRGVEKRRAGRPLPEGSEPVISLVDWLERDGRELVADFDRLYVPKNEPRWLQRNALVAVGNEGRSEDDPLARGFVDDDDPVLRSAAARAVARIGTSPGT